MCGIAGVANLSGDWDRRWLASAGRSIAHRGPDGNGEWQSEDGSVGFAHRRLSVVDLSPLGHQPMHLPDYGLSVVFNGEIYNHKELRVELETYGIVFHSNSDTEVLLASYAHWGESFVSRLNGMFAFCIYDGQKQRLFLARDRAGEKPLFYHLSGSSLYFASELKALLANPALSRRIDPEALDCYLTLGFVPGDLCILEGYKKLPPAHAMRFDLYSGTAQGWAYWQLPELEDNATATDENDLLDELEALLEDAVGRQLEADVPVGILLSGGVDSSLVTAMAIRRSSRVRTFSVGFPGHGNLDETPHARLVARYFGTEHVELPAEPITADLLHALARQFDEPIADSSILPTWLVCNLIRKHCTVALGGDGGDELFGGYNHYNRLLWMEKRFSRIPAWLRHGVARISEKILPVGIKGRNYLLGLDVDLQRDLPLIATYFDQRTRRSLMEGHAGYRLVGEKVYSRRVSRQTNILQRATRTDFNNYLPNDILVKVDRASMLNSLEVRAPLLDYRVIEFAFRKVPTQLKANTHDKKIILKRLAARVLPPEFDRKRKQGFSIPIADWLKAGPLRELFWSALTSADCLFDADNLYSLLKGQDLGRNNGERLFALVQFELWRKTYGASI